MEFRGPGVPLNGDGVDRACDALGVGAAELWAVLAVETAGFGFLADRRPRILFERHVFRRLTRGVFDAIHPDLSHPEGGGYVGGAGEYPRLQRAMALHREAALKSASWGIGQVMGFNHQAAGFASVDAMVTGTVADENAQLAAMAAFIRNGGLDAPLRRQDWAGFARGYNGPNFRANNYDLRLADAHQRFRTALPDLMLRNAQAALLFLGFDPGPIDGLRGARTRQALVKYQQTHQLPAVGELDAQTTAHLLHQAFPAVLV